MTQLPEGLNYRAFTFQDSRCHLLTIDLTKRDLRPVLAKQQFPFNEGHAQAKAIEEGAVACADGGFNITLYHGFNIQDQPQHALVVDGEIWTTGLGAGGYGVLIGNGWMKCQKNRIQVHIWRPDGTSFEVEHVNRGHDGEVVAFTPRGGKNEYPKYRGKRFVSLEPTVTPFPDAPRSMLVVKVADTPLKVWPKVVVLESTYDLGLKVGDVVKWKQNLGTQGVRHIVSGWPQLLRDGENVTSEVELDPQASHGPDAWFTMRNPRSSLGCSQDGETAYILVVEGRLPNEWRPDAEKSRGLRLKPLAEAARKHGIANLVDMDGGGSAFLYVKGLPLIPGCYNAVGTIEGQRRAHFSAAVF